MWTQLTSPATQQNAPSSHNRPTHYVDTGLGDKEVEHKQPYKAIASKSATHKAKFMQASQHEHSKDVQHCTHRRGDAPFSR